MIEKESLVLSYGRGVINSDETWWHAESLPDLPGPGSGVDVQDAPEVLDARLMVH